MNELKTRDQRYAAVIYAQVIELEPQKKEEWVKDYGRLANKLPVLVKTAGLAQALSFVQAKGGSGYERFLHDLCDSISKIAKKSIDLPNESRNAKLPDYLWLTQQVMTALHWYKRFAQSVLEVKNDG